MNKEWNNLVSVFEMEFDLEALVERGNASEAAEILERSRAETRQKMKEQEKIEKMITAAAAFLPKDLRNFVEYGWTIERRLSNMMGDQWWNLVMILRIPEMAVIHLRFIENYSGLPAEEGYLITDNSKMQKPIVVMEPFEDHYYEGEIGEQWLVSHREAKQFAQLPKALAMAKRIGPELERIEQRVIQKNELDLERPETEAVELNDAEISLAIEGPVSGAALEPKHEVSFEAVLGEAIRGIVRAELRKNGAGF